MNKFNRDFLVVSKNFELNQEELKETILRLDKVLLHVENFNNTCLVNEVFDLNKYKIIKNLQQIGFYITNKSNKPFIFINNKN